MIATKNESENIVDPNEEIVASAKVGPKRNICSTIMFVVMVVLSTAVGIWSIRMYNFRWHIFTTKYQSESVYPNVLGDFYLHITGGIITLLLGPLQFIESLRKTKWHKYVGRVYVVSVLYGAVSGFSLSLVSFGTAWANVGFLFLSIAWFVTGLMAYHYIRNREISKHRDWMIRNYALVFASVTIRIYISIGITINAVRSKGKVFELDRSQYDWCVWFSWVPNAILAELYLWKSKKKRVGRE